MCGDDDTHPFGGRSCGDGSIVALRRDGLAGLPTVGVETQGQRALYEGLANWDALRQAL